MLATWSFSLACPVDIIRQQGFCHTSGLQNPIYQVPQPHRPRCVPPFKDWTYQGRSTAPCHRERGQDQDYP